MFKKQIHRFWLSGTSLLLILIQLFFSFFKPVGKVMNAGARITSCPKNISHVFIEPLHYFSNGIKSLYDSLQLNLKGLSYEAFELAHKGFQFLLNEGRIVNDSILTIIDFSKPSFLKRFFVLDLKNMKLLIHSLVAHGKNSGKESADFFSNIPQSQKSSLGFYLTGEDYFGENGYSLKLIGLEKGVNDNALRRGIVIHGANYVNETYILQQGYIGRSQGCPAVPVELARPVIQMLKNGTCLFIYHPRYKSALAGFAH
ncbi:MAG: murein L,D-transpeptidase catalytic domain family protein [Chitinophagaceae bacterium]|nr:murein L,D-transpeptidase catalytic domain family protein [Chitinophagaceae bacterium]